MSAYREYVSKPWFTTSEALSLDHLSKNEKKT